MNRDSSQSLTIQRSLLAVPALASRFFEKAARGEADSVFLDLEDSIPTASKVEARMQAIQAINAVDWGNKSLGLRVNALDTQWGLRDVIEAVKNCSRLDFIMVPRVEKRFDVQHVDSLLRGLELEAHRSSPIALHAIIETPLGLANIEDIAGVPSRMDAMSFGFGDFSISMGTYESIIGASGEQWGYALARIATACKAHGLRAVDGPHTNFGDLDGLRARATLVARHGFEGKWAIHPSQIAICREVFSPTPAHLAWAKATLAALEPALAAGTGAIGRNGQLLDVAHGRLANEIIARAARDGA